MINRLNHRLNSSNKWRVAALAFVVALAVAWLSSCRNINNPTNFVTPDGSRVLSFGYSTVLGKTYIDGRDFNAMEMDGPCYIRSTRGFRFGIRFRRQAGPQNAGRDSSMRVMARLASRQIGPLTTKN